MAYRVELKNMLSAISIFCTWRRMPPRCLRSSGLEELEKSIRTLEASPRRCPIAPESKRAKRAVRHLLYGKRPNVYRVIYEIDERQKVVRVLTVRHGAMEPLEPIE